MKKWIFSLCASLLPLLATAQEDLLYERSAQRYQSAWASLRRLAMAFPLRVFGCRRRTMSVLHRVFSCRHAATVDDRFSTASFLPSPTAESFFSKRYACHSA